MHSEMIASRPITFVLACTACSAASEPTPDAPADAPEAALVDIYEDADGAFSPSNVVARAGNQIVWHFPQASPGNAVVRRVDNAGTYEIAPYTPAFANELAGPMITAPSGVFALGPTGLGFVEQSAPCAPPTQIPIATRSAGAATEYLCRTSDPSRKGRALASTWADPNITGVFIRLQWKDIQPTLGGPYVFDTLRAEADMAIANGKLFSVVIESGRDGQPDWLFEPAPLGLGLPGYDLDSNDDNDLVCRAQDTVRYADPTRSEYKTAYFAALTAVANELKRNSAHYRALAYIKPSGANRATGENRLPTRCKTGAGCICNNQVWAEQAAYKPSNLYAFYREQFALIAEQFPGKSMAYMLIQAGFPRVGEDQCWLDAANAVHCPTGAVDLVVPGGTAQTRVIIDDAGATYPDGRFVVMHQGLDAAPGSVNPFVIDHGTEFGTPTMFQTSAGGQVGSPADVGNTIENLWANSGASAIELYEERIWEATNAPLGGATYPDRTIGDWNTELHDRRRVTYSALGDPAPTTYTFTLGAPLAPASSEQDLYIDPRNQPVTQAAGCLDGFSPCVNVDL